ncbi:hypothetical protein BD626DRAFT_480698 [Schizophyllum amplum]|uniref:protein-tyrosine-phosphatase n=1 Tax=Schizophyllum amplum TaxID=97359 RepID=A0A550CTF5_9AGAR|nr:hypothetical protein BD626DRAFT_480698 [Auriculariopsis ampla]
MFVGSVSADEIIPGQVFLGNLSAALSLEYRQQHGITHVLSVCPEYEPTKRDHMMIPVDDTEYDDLLVHLPRGCDFIQAALDDGGKVLVHCVMGVSRSTTVLAAYLMRLRRCTPAEALSFIKSARPRVRPNYGFLRQLDVFAECNYAPSPENPAYLSWKRRHKQEMTAFLNKIVDTTGIIPDQLYLSDDFPEDTHQAESLLAMLGVTHMLTLSPASKVPPSSLLTSCENIVMSPTRKEELLLSLPAVCQYISDAISGGGIVLVHSQAESKACTAVSAYLMASRGISAQAARDKVEKDMPLFNASSTFKRTLALFEACAHKPYLEHPAVQQWLFGETPTPPNGLADMNPNLTAAALLGAFNHAQRTKHELPILASTSCKPACSAQSVETDRSCQRKRRSLSPRRTIISCADEVKLRATAARLLDDTSLDMTTFGQALGALSLQSSAKGGKQETVRAPRDALVPEPHAVIVQSG